MSRLVPVLVLLAACAPAGESSTTVTPAPTTTTATTIPTPQQAEEAFVRCLVEGGVELPDVSGDDLPLLDRLAPHLDLNEPSIRQHVIECSPVLLLAGSIRLDPEVAQLVEAQLATFSECMRDEGIVEFPDPLGDGAWSLDEIPFDAPAFDDAMASCTARLVVDS
jgi:hypothetical protein